MAISVVQHEQAIREEKDEEKRYVLAGLQREAREASDAERLAMNPWANFSYGGTKREKRAAQGNALNMQDLAWGEPIRPYETAVYTPAIVGAGPNAVYGNRRSQQENARAQARQDHDYGYSLPANPNTFESSGRGRDRNTDSSSQGRQRNRRT